MENNTVFRIKDYEKHFEVSQSKRYVKIGWIPFPIKHDGKGYRRVARHEHDCELFTAFILMVQVAGKCTKRGLLIDDDENAITAEDLHDKTGFRKDIFDLAFKELTNSRIGWIETVSLEAARSELRVARSELGFCSV